MEKMSDSKIWPDLRECVCLKKNDYIYYFAKNYNVLCRIDIEQGINEVITSFNDEFFDLEYLVTDLVEYDGIIVCIPYAATHIHMFDIEQGKEIRHSLFEKCISRGEYFNRFAEEGICYLFPLYGNKLITIDLEQKRIINSIDISKKYKDFSGEGYQIFSRSGCYKFQTKLYMCLYETGMIAEYDYQTTDIQFYRTDVAKSHYTFITGNGHELYILNSEGILYLYDIASKRNKKAFKLKLIIEEAVRYKYSIKRDKYIYIFKYIPSDEFIRINIVEEQIEVLSLAETYGLNNIPDNLLNYMAAEENKVYFLSQKHELYILDIGSGAAEVMPLKLEIDKIDDIIGYRKKIMKQEMDKVIPEGAYIWTLQNYIENLNDIRESEKKNSNKIKDIYRRILWDSYR